MAKEEQVHPFSNAKRMKPTLKHRPAIWGGILGTVYAMNDDYQVKYFDYDYNAARKWAGTDQDDRDPRVFRTKTRLCLGSDGYSGPRKGQLVVYVLKIPKANSSTSKQKR